MMKNNKKCIIPFGYYFGNSIFYSCEGKDGNWESMKWEMNMQSKNKNHIEAPKVGNAYYLCLKITDRFWLYSISENDMIKSLEKKQNAKGDRLSVDIGKIIRPIISSSHNNHNHTLSVGVKAGKVLDSFLFEQNKFERGASKNRDSKRFFHRWKTLIEGSNNNEIFISNQYPEKQGPSCLAPPPLYIEAAFLQSEKISKELLYSFLAYTYLLQYWYNCILFHF